MKPESELQAEETAFVNTCRKHAEMIGTHESGRYRFAVHVYDREGRLRDHSGTFDCTMLPLEATGPLTLEEFDKVLNEEAEAGEPNGPTLFTVEEIEAKLPTLPPRQLPAQTPEEAWTDFEKNRQAEMAELAKPRKKK